MSDTYNRQSMSENFIACSQRCSTEDIPNYSSFPLGRYIGRSHNSCEVLHLFCASEKAGGITLYQQASLFKDVAIIL
jgi:hypothetical protein